MVGLTMNELEILACPGSKAGKTSSSDIALVVTPLRIILLYLSNYTVSPPPHHNC